MKKQTLPERMPETLKALIRINRKAIKELQAERTMLQSKITALACEVEQAIADYE